MLLKMLVALIIIGLLASSVQHPPSETARHANAASDLWVDSTSGNDANDGRSAANALRSIQAAASIALPGTVVHILPGVYREAITPTSDGTADNRILYIAEAGAGTVKVRGSEPASSLAWKRLALNNIGLQPNIDPANIYYADLSGWRLKGPPRFIVEMNDAGEIVARLMPAREPDLRADAEWKDTEFWWLADGGSAVAGCDPATDSDRHCDLPSRSFTQLTDTVSDTDPAGVEPGNLTTLPDLTGATLVAMDAQHALYVYRRSIVSHDIVAGRITVDENCDNDGNPGLGWGSKYYIENHAALLDQPGEWWFDGRNSHLYLWSPNGQNPGMLNLEISRLDTGFDLTNRSYITLDSLTIELFNDEAYAIQNQDPSYKAFGDVVRNSTIRYANEGVALYQYSDRHSPADYAIGDFLLENSKIAYMDTYGIESSFWWPNAPSPGQFDHSGIHNTVLRDNELHHLGFNSDARTAVGLRIFFPDHLRLERNYIHHVANAGAQLQLSLIESGKQYGFAPQEIKLGDILVSDNTFEWTCMRASDCGALKFGGSDRPRTHVFRDVLVTGNVFRDAIGWSYVSALRGGSAIGDGNGLYIDYASGIHAYRNIAYNNTGAGFKLSCLWRDGDVILYNNIAANNSMYGFKLTGDGNCDNHGGSVNTQVVNNILINDAAYGMQIESAYDSDGFGNLVIDHNLYYKNGWDSVAAWGKPADLQLYQGHQSAQYFFSQKDIKAGTPWEARGVEGNPAFLEYDPADHNLFDNSWPDFHLTASSVNALDGGTVELPDSLAALLAEFEIADARLGAAFDIGRFETGEKATTSTRQSATLQPATRQAATQQPGYAKNPICLPGAAILSVVPIVLIWPHRMKTRSGSRQRKHAGSPEKLR